MREIYRIFALTRPYWSRVALGTLLGFIFSAINGGIAWLVKPALDIVIVGQRFEYSVFIALGIFALFTAKGLVEFGQTYLMRSAGFQLIRDMQNRMHRQILRLPVGYFHRESSGVIMSRVINDVRVLGSVFSEVIKTMIVEVPTVIVLLVIALYRKWDLTLLSIVLVPLLAHSTRKLGKQIKKRSLGAQGRLSFLTHRLGETITGAKVIRVFNRQDYRENKFDGENRGVYRENVRVVKLKEMTKVLIDVVSGGAIAVVIWYGFTQVKDGIITTGDFGTIIAAIYLLFKPVRKIGESYTFLQEVRASLERVEALLGAGTEKSGTTEITGFRDVIRYEGVSFSYGSDSPPVLKEVRLSIRAGEVIAIVGPSGAGKTTLCDLLPRFYDPTSGRVTIDGTDLRELDLSSLRELIGVVSQDVILFHDTVRDNIAFGRPGASLEEIRRAAELAYASEFIEKLPEGYDTVIGERGLTLSGGQRQRLAIARAILKNPPVLILDEATSSLDTVSEALVQKALEGLMRGRTTIVIAHRISTIKNADRIVVVEDGRITDMGTHEELLSRGSTYSKLCSYLETR